jgi:hypothetical protein
MHAVYALICLLGLCLALSASSGLAQVMGDEAEMTRLRMKGEEAIANDDPDGAAMTMGRAALLAGQLAKKQTGPDAVLHKSREALFRSQEHTYRAMALFRRAGGQLPASSGVCGSLALAQNSLRHAGGLLVDLPSGSSAGLIEQTAGLRESVDTWTTVLESMIAEYQCP